MLRPHSGLPARLSWAVALVFALSWALAALPVAAADAPAAGKPRFDVLEFAVQGNTVLKTTVIERAIYPHMGQQRSMDDVESARAALEAAYRSAGYSTVAVDIPEQQVSAGVVVLQVVEAPVSRLRVTGSRYFSQDRIIEQVPAVAEGRVPNLLELQAQLAGVNRTSDRRVQPLLRAGKAPGTTEVDLTVEDQLPVHGSVELNNKASANTSPTRLLASLRYDNLLQRDHSLGLTVQTAPQKTSEVQLFSANYAIPLGQDQLSFSYLHSNSETAAGAGDTTVFGKGSAWGLRRSVVLQLADKAYHAVNLSLDYKRFGETVALANGSGFATPLRYAPLGLGYIGITEDASGRWQLGGNLVVGLRGLLSSDAEFADKRYGASSGFSVLKLDLSREQKLPWAGLSLYGRLDTQFSGEPLVSNEQMVAGGADTVRGYHESAAVGDTGLRATLELRSGELLPASWPLLGSLTTHAFFDGATLQLRQPLPGQASRARLLSSGVGLRVKGKPYGSLQLNLAVPLAATSTTNRGDVLLHAAGAFDF